MEIKEFQQKLSEVLELSRKNGKKIRAGLVENFFSGEGLQQSQIEKVYDYLVIQGIRVEGRGSVTKNAVGLTAGGAAGRADGKASDKAEEGQPAALSAEEADYLEDYMATLRDIAAEEPGERQRLFREAQEGSEAAKSRLAELYMPEVAETAKALHREEVFIGDMISEGNIGLLTALGRLGEAGDINKFICGEIRNSILLMLEEHSGQKQGDDVLVEKVRDLEAKIKELLDDEDAKYSVEELSAFLDMDVDEIRSVLSLTGDDK